ncbi:MAG: hypothetical protein IKA65_11490 [Lentisphaeria bacterium]|nr:hypothetical protein [Lentisphaeria bacterium]
MQENTRWQIIKEFIRRDFWRKLVALFLALLLYLAIAPRTSEKREKSFTSVPVTIELPANLALSDNTVRRVKVTLSGNAKALDEIDPGALRIRTEVNGEGFIAGEPYQLRLRREDISGLVYGVKVESISPRDLVLDLEPVISKHLPIRPRYDSLGKLPQDYEIASVKFVPAKALISGPAKVLDSIQEIFTTPIPIDEQVTDSFEYRCNLRTPPGTRADRSEVEAQVEVVKAMTTHTFRAVPLLIIQSAERTRKFQVTSLEPETVTVIAGGPRGTLARMHSREINASINLDKIDKPGTYNLPVSITITNPTPGLSVKKFQPATAKVTVQQE